MNIVNLPSFSGASSTSSTLASALQPGKIVEALVLALLDDGRKLEVRGYIGIPLLGRSQTWVRKE